MAEIRPIRNQKQGDGSRKQWQNCAAAAAADAALRAKKNVNPRRGYPWATSSLPTMSSAIRKWCDSHFNTGVVSGLYQRWVNAAIRAMYGVSMGYYWGPGSGDSAATQWRKFNAFLVAHRGCSVSITYSLILGTAAAGFSGFRGRHRWFVNERRYNAAKARYDYLVFGPEHDGRHSWVPRGPIWVSGTTLKKAMLASGIEVSYTPQTGG